MRKKGSWSALKKHLQQCYKYNEPEDADDSTQEFGGSSESGVAGVCSAGQSRDDHQAIDSSEGREPSTSDSISEFVDEEQEEQEVIKVKRRNRSLAEELGVLNVSPVRLTSCNASGAAPFPPSGLEDGEAAFKNVCRSGSVGRPTSSTRAGVDADTGTGVARGRCRVPGKLLQSGRGRAHGASLDKLNVQGRFHAIGRGIDVENAAYTDCATSWSDTSSSSQGRLIRRLEKELEIQPTLTVSTRMSRTGPRRRIPRTDPHPRAAAAFGIKHGWNASTRTAQDFQARLRDRERAVMKRERALKYAHSIRRLRHNAQQKCEPWPADGGAVARTPDKPGGVWSWLERAARMGANGARDNRIFDNDSNPRNGISESCLSVQSTIAMCTTGPIPADGARSDHDEFWSPSLREQGEAKAQCVNLPASEHASRAPGYCKSGCLDSAADQPAMGIKGSAHPDDAQEQIIQEDRTSSEEPQCCPASVAKFKFARFCGTRGRLNFGTNQVEGESCLEDEDDDHDHSPVESVGSCAAPVAIRSSKYKLSSHFNSGTQKVRFCGGTQLKILNSNSQSRGRVDFVPARPSAATGDDADSIGSTGTSLRKKLWKP